MTASVRTRGIHTAIAALAALAALAAPDAAAQERFSFATNESESNGRSPTVIEGILHRPPGPGPFPAVIGLHGCSGLVRADGSVSPLFDAWARHLSANGYLVLLVDSFTARGVRSICGRGNAVDPFDERPRDAYGALRFLQARADVRADQIALMGWSHGGGSLLYATARGARARPPNLKDDFRAAIAIYPAWCDESIHGRTWLPSQPLLVLLGEKDERTPAAPCMEMMARARTRGADVEVTVYANAHHGFDLDTPPQPRNDAHLPGTKIHPLVGGNPDARAAAYARALDFLGRKLGAQ